jgi:RNase H-like domain found in reverse transcriptase/Reverse transcriptase (RNA-dependent DNA polymerase)
VGAEDLAARVSDGPKFDVRWGYNNIQIKEGDGWKAAFKTNRGLFKLTVMFFGMCNSPATFQAMMNMIFEDLIDNGIIIIYMDILIVEKTPEELEKLTRHVLEWLLKHHLYLKPKKCEFNKKKIEYLGMIIEEGKISMDAVKLKGLKDWPTLTTVKQVWSFLGFRNFYWKFIPKYLDVAKPLNDLMKKDKQFEWTEDCQTAFDTLKQRFTKEPVLLMPDHTRPFQLESDTSKYTTRAILTQSDSNGKRHPVAFLSKTFNNMEWNCKIYNRELPEIVQALEEWRHYIQGSGFKITVFIINVMIFSIWLVIYLIWQG